MNVKGQVTLPLSIRKKYGIKPKDIVTIEDVR
ncbi:MAG: AbrB/MazE/SpoVT family DNA-binding domain-containing protein [Desulfosudis oleivorans]|nr:AbrB/MazE/SpoVT family DNA-binding domain-containing protein [Desulfosudis oleivorans]